MDFNIINYLIDVTSWLASRHQISWNSMKCPSLVIGFIMYTYILRSHLPTSHISRFSSPFIPYAGLGINSTISTYAGGAVIFRTAIYWNKNVFCRIYLIKNLSFNSDVVFCFIGVLEMPKKFSWRSEVKNMFFWATPIFTVLKFIDFVSNGAER